jgi:hypothetical protein
LIYYDDRRFFFLKNVNTFRVDKKNKEAALLRERSSLARQRIAAAEAARLIAWPCLAACQVLWARAAIARGILAGAAQACARSPCRVGVEGRGWDMGAPIVPTPLGG